MLVFGAPAFLLAGVLAALVPLALHLIRRRPPAREPLPTARFLAEERRSAVRVSRPTDLLLLALRMLLLLLAGAALARPAWRPSPEGTSEIVLLDRAWTMGIDGAWSGEVGDAGPGSAWRRAVETARRTLLGPDGEARGELILFDEKAERVPRSRVTAALFDSLRMGGGWSSDLAAALRLVPDAARELRGADSVRVTLLSDLRRADWTPGTAALRRAAWPGSIAVPNLPAAVPADLTEWPVRSRGRDAVIVAAPGEGGYVEAALAATGWNARRIGPGDAPPSDAGLYLLLANPAPSSVDPLQLAVEGGALLVADARVRDGLAGVLPWEGFGVVDERRGGSMWIGGETALHGAAGRAPGRPKRGARLVAAWDDGAPAAAAAPYTDGCGVYVAAHLEAGDLPLSAAFPRALDRLARACREARPPQDALQPLDAGARSLLRGTGPAAVASNRIAGAGGGVPLGRWIWGAALLVALIETYLAYGRRKAG